MKPKYKIGDRVIVKYYTSSLTSQFRRVNIVGHIKEIVPDETTVYYGLGRWSLYRESEVKRIGPLEPFIRLKHNLTLN